MALVRGNRTDDNAAEQPEDEVDEDEGQEQSTIENYTGVSIKVRLTCSSMCIGAEAYRQTE